MASDISPKAAPGTLWKKPREERKAAQPIVRRKPINPVGKVARQRAADKRSKERQEPARDDGQRQCYIGLDWTDRPVLEHVLDASVYPNLRSDPRNHRWACGPHNIAKKNGTLSPAEQERVEREIDKVWEDVYGQDFS